MDRDGLDDVRVERPLGEPGRPVDGLRVLGECVDEEAPDDLPFLFGIGDAREGVEEAVGRVDAGHWQAEVPERGQDVAALVLPKKPRVDEDAPKALPHRLPDEDRRDRRIDTARQTAEDDSFRHRLADLRDGRLPEARHRPARRASAGVVEERLEHLGAVLGVLDLGVKLEPVESPDGILERGDGCVRRSRRDCKALRNGLDVVAVAHPDRLGRAQRAQEAPAGHVDHGPAVLPARSAPDLAAESAGHELHSVAESQDGNAEVENAFVAPGRVVVVDARRAAGQDDSLRPEGRDVRSPESSTGERRNGPAPHGFAAR